MMAGVEEVVAHHERATLRVGGAGMQIPTIAGVTSAATTIPTTSKAQSTQPNRRDRPPR
jgi:hypothetical protein